MSSERSLHRQAIPGGGWRPVQARWAQAHIAQRDGDEGRGELRQLPALAVCPRHREALPLEGARHRQGSEEIRHQLGERLLPLLLLAAGEELVRGDEEEDGEAEQQRREGAGRGEPGEDEDAAQQDGAADAVIEAGVHQLRRHLQDGA